MRDKAAHALLAATAQIGLALRESQQPVAELGASISRVSDTLSALQAIPAEPLGAVALQRLLDELQTHVREGIQHLQFYDRMVQHLSHLQDYLIRVANELGSGASTEAAGDFWDGLHAQLRERLISDEQRRLFDLYLNPDRIAKVSAQIVRPELSPPGSLEFF